MKKILIILVLVVLAGVLVLYFWNRSGKSATSFKTAAVTRGGRAA